MGSKQVSFVERSSLSQRVPLSEVPLYSINYCCVYVISHLLSFVRYFATGGADALTCLWDVAELVCIRTFARLE